MPKRTIPGGKRELVCDNDRSVNRYNPCSKPVIRRGNTICDNKHPAKEFKEYAGELQGFDAMNSGSRDNRPKVDPNSEEGKEVIERMPRTPGQIYDEIMSKD